MAAPGRCSMLVGARPLVPLVALALVPAARAAERMPGPAPLVRAGAVDNAACEGCHAEIAAEWRESQHASSFVDAAFQREWAREDGQFCRECHAPEAGHAKTYDRDEAALGVACTTCHVPETTVLATSGSTTSAPHPLARSQAFADARACAGCHEFEFSDVHLRRAPDLMQRTVAEHAASPHASSSCADCHMPFVPDRGDGHRAHRFAASRDPEMLRSAADIVAVRKGASTVQIVLRSRAAGHAFPTGDLLRRLEVRAAVLGRPGKAHEAVRYLARHFASVRQLPHVAVKTEIADDRVSADGTPTIVLLELGDTAVGWPVAWWVDYQRVGHPSPRDESLAFVEGEIALAGGVLPAVLEENE